MPTPITDAERQALVQRYTQGYQTVLDAFSAARRATAEILAGMTAADWQRSGTHSESGAYSAEDWLAICAAHAHDHAAQIRRARAQASSGSVRQRHALSA